MQYMISLVNTKKYSDGLRVSTAAISFVKEKFGDHHLYLSDVYSKSAFFNYKLGNVNQAESHYKESIKILELTDGDARVKLISALDNLSWMYEREKKYAESIKLQHKNIKIVADVFGKQSRQVEDKIRKIDRLTVLEQNNLLQSKKDIGSPDNLEKSLPLLKDPKKLEEKIKSGSQVNKKPPVKDTSNKESENTFFEKISVSNWIVIIASLGIIAFVIVFMKETKE